jgi:hypothetical protein
MFLVLASRLLIEARVPRLFFSTIHSHTRAYFRSQKKSDGNLRRKK